MSDVDFIVLGAGIAGASIAAELARAASVLLIEREAQPGYHATGRSAAMFAPAYGNPTVRALSRASGPFLSTPPPGFSPVPLAHPRATLFVSGPGQQPQLDQLANTPEIAATVREISAEECLTLLPILKSDFPQSGLIDESSLELDVDAILQGYLRLGRSRGVRLVTSANDQQIMRNGANWSVSSNAGQWSAPVLVNAAGAWADEVAASVGARPIGLMPLRRTMVTIDAPADHDCSAWPFVIDAGETFYFKPDAGRLLLSPADETPSEPTDAAAEELDVAIAVDRFETATTMSVRRIHSRWAGLRSFTADRSPVVGYAAELPGYFWMAAAGGYGIQMAPALAEFGASLALRQTIPDHISEENIGDAVLSPGRFA